MPALLLVHNFSPKRHQLIVSANRGDVCNVFAQRVDIAPANNNDDGGNFSSLQFYFKKKPIFLTIASRAGEKDKMRKLSSQRRQRVTCNTLIEISKDGRVQAPVTLDENAHERYEQLVYVSRVTQILLDNNMDYYKLLGLAKRDVTEQRQIRKAFLCQISKFHPDHTGDAATSTTAAAIYHAYSILSDPDKKAEYDQQYSAVKTKAKFLRLLTADFWKSLAATMRDMTLSLWRHFRSMPVYAQITAPIWAVPALLGCAVYKGLKWYHELPVHLGWKIAFPFLIAAGVVLIVAVPGLVPSTVAAAIVVQSTGLGVLCGGLGGFFRLLREDIRNASLSVEDQARINKTLALFTSLGALAGGIGGALTAVAGPALSLAMTEAGITVGTTVIPMATCAAVDSFLMTSIGNLVPRVLDGEHVTKGDAIIDLALALALGFAAGAAAGTIPGVYFSSAEIAAGSARHELLGAAISRCGVKDAAGLNKRGLNELYTISRLAIRTSNNAMKQLANQVIHAIGDEKEQEVKVKQELGKLFKPVYAAQQTAVEADIAVEDDSGDGINERCFPRSTESAEQLFYFQRQNSLIDASSHRQQ